MGRGRRGRLLVAIGAVGALVMGAVARRTSAASFDPAREVMLETRRARIQAARSELVRAPGEDQAS